MPGPKEGAVHPVVGQMVGPVVLSGGAYTPAWTPASLSSLYTWVETDISNLYQNTAGTTPVTTDGQSVAHWEDKSGGGHDFTNDGGAATPTYKTTYVRFDGSNDTVYTPWTSTNEWLFGISYIPRRLASSNCIVQLANNYYASSSALLLLMTTASGTEMYIDGAYRFAVACSVGDRMTHIIRVTKPAANFLVDVWVNGSKQTQYNGGPSLIFPANWITIGLGFQTPTQSDVYASVMAEGSYSDDDAVALSDYLTAIE